VAEQQVVEKIIRIDVIASQEASANIKALATNMSQVDKNTAALQKNVESGFSSLSGFATKLGAFAAGFFATDQILSYSKAIIEAAQSYAILEGRLKLVLGGESAVAKATDEIIRISRESGRELDSTAKLYEKVTRAGQNYGLTQAQATKVTEGFAASLRLSGSSTQEANAALIQFGQALVSNRFAGDEFRSISENNAAFMNALAKALGVTLGELRKLGTEGKLDVETLIKAMLDGGKDGVSMLDRLNEAAAKIPKTFAQSFEGLKSEATGAIGELARLLTGGIGGDPFKALTDSIGSLRKELRQLADESEARGDSNVGRIVNGFKWMLNELGKMTPSGLIRRLIYGDQEPESQTDRIVGDIGKINAELDRLKQVEAKLNDQIASGSLGQREEQAATERLSRIQNQIRDRQAALNRLSELNNRTMPGGLDEINANETARRFSQNHFPPKPPPKPDRVKKEPGDTPLENYLQAEIAKGLDLADKLDSLSGKAETDYEKLVNAVISGKLKVGENETQTLLAALDAAARVDTYHVSEESNKRMERLAEQVSAQAGQNPLFLADQSLDEFKKKAADAADQLAELYKLMADPTLTKPERKFLEAEIGKLENFVDQSASLSKIFEKNFQKAIDNIAGEFTDFITGTQSSFSKMITNIMNSLVRLTISDFLTAQLRQFYTSAQDAGGASAIFSGFQEIFTNMGAWAQANGGIMTGFGPMDLKRYSRGGIAHTPQLAMYGEGSRPEAFVPLPDGRSIPVSMGKSAAPIINIYSSGDASEVSTQTRSGPDGQQQVDVYLDKKVRDIINSDVNSGRGVARTIEQRYGLNRAYGAR